MFSGIVYWLKECEITIKDGLPKEKDPLYITADGKLASPDGPNLEWGPKTSTIITCPGSKNSLSIGGDQVKMECVKGNLSAGGKKVDPTELNCKSAIAGDVKRTTTKCNNDGIIQKIGFDTDLPKIGFIDYIDVCYNDEAASVVYTYHVIRGKAISHSVSNNDRPGFKAAGMPKGVKPIDAYTQSAQTKKFTELLGPKQAAKLISKTSFLARGHLSPDNDGIFRSWQAATYYFINVAPEWQIVNAGNWLRVENLARAHASKLNDDLDVYTGVSGILSLPSDKGEEVPLTLADNGRIPVPKYYWKVLKYKDSGIAFVTLNNPFATKEETICKDVCDKYGWANPSYSDLSKGFTVCCEVSDLMKAATEVPKDATVKKTMSK